MTFQEWQEKRKLEQDEIDLELDKLEVVCLPEELDKRFLKDFGCINLRSDEFYYELNLARKWHARLLNRYPEQHKLEFVEPYRCYHETFCRCGFREASDSLSTTLYY